MRYHSTRDNSISVTASQAIMKGIADDGGLYLPDSVPSINSTEISAMLDMDYRSRAKYIMGLFLDEFSQDELEEFVRSAYGKNFDDERIAPLEKLDDKTSFLELWHGPTCAFKDMALQILPYLLTSSLHKNGEKKTVCILVATSGDTGKAALEGFRDVDGTRIMVFFPNEGVSDVQKLQMVTQEGNNVSVCAVEGNFDDAQTGVKKIFTDKKFAERIAERGFFLSSANSINWGRLLPQVAYYFSAYCDCINNGTIKLGDKINFCVPTGNFGDILAGWYAKQMGLPVYRLICASNENDVLTEFINTGVYDRNRPFHKTASPSMDILISSNLERLLNQLAGDEKTAEYMRLLSESGRYSVDTDVLTALQAEFTAGACDDAQSGKYIRKLYEENSYLMDTHTAVGYTVLENYRHDSGDDTPAVVLSTASPFKFCNSVLKALGKESEKPGTELLQMLAEETERSVPAPLAGLDVRNVRFEKVVDKSAMLDEVDIFLM